MSKPTLILIIILFFLTLGLLTLAINKSSYNPKALHQPPIPSIEVKKPTIPETSLLFGSLEVIPASDSARKAYSLPIIIKAQTNTVTSVQLELAFDPGVLTNINIKPAHFFENPAIFINKIDSKNGRISYAFGKVASQSGEQGEDMLAILTFQARTPIDETRTRAPKQTSITFLPKTFVAAEDLLQSALKSTNSAELDFNP